MRPWSGRVRTDRNPGSVLVISTPASRAKVVRAMSSVVGGIATAASRAKTAVGKHIARTDNNTATVARRGWDLISARSSALR
jgi:hypothetical protein